MILLLILAYDPLGAAVWGTLGLWMGNISRVKMLGVRCPPRTPLWASVDWLSP